MFSISRTYTCTNRTFTSGFDLTPPSSWKPNPVWESLRWSQCQTEVDSGPGLTYFFKIELPDVFLVIPSL